MYYITYVFGMAGLSGNANLVASSINYVINMVITVPALLFLDRIGRRVLLVGGGISLSIWWFACAGLLATYGSEAPPGGIDGVPEESWQISGPPAKAVIACSYLVVASFAPTWGPTSWVYPPEIFPLRIRGKAVSITTASNWIFNFALGYFTPPAFVNIKWKTYLIFGIFSITMAIHSFFFFPETAGKTLEEVESIFLSKTPAWKTRVDYKKIRAVERGEVDPEKNVSRHQENKISERSTDASS